jgi:flagellar biosynthetic protein FlhB
VAEESDLEKTEPASPRRLEQAREEGDVPRSRELATCTILLAAGGGLWVFGGGLVRSLNQTLAAGLGFQRTHAYDPGALFAQIGSHAVDVLLAFAPIAILLVIVALASPLLIGGWLFSAKALQPKFGKLNPLKGLSNMVSVNAAVELGKAIAKTLLVGAVAWLVVRHQIDAMLGLGVENADDGIAHLGRLLLTGFIAIVSALVLIAGIDAPFQMWRYANKLKMTRQEVRQESKESEGDPQIKARIRAQQREMARRRMMADVPPELDQDN